MSAAFVIPPFNIVKKSTFLQVSISFISGLIIVFQYFHTDIKWNLLADHYAKYFSLLGLFIVYTACIYLMSIIKIEHKE